MIVFLEKFNFSHPIEPFYPLYSSISKNFNSMNLKEIWYHFPLSDSTQKQLNHTEIVNQQTEVPQSSSVQ